MQDAHMIELNRASHAQSPAHGGEVNGGEHRADLSRFGASTISSNGRLSSLADLKA
jgi:hypothetical protein